mmetsp:Transcript_40654/g.81533  ORF Transcript_40654/g.81533 Transcript_40654/m.81533 type:complete len:200 (+) Transcript_40654:1044-1643(+)
MVREAVGACWRRQWQQSRRIASREETRRGGPSPPAVQRRQVHRGPRPHPPPPRPHPLPRPLRPPCPPRPRPSPPPSPSSDPRFPPRPRHRHPPRSHCRRRQPRRRHPRRRHPRRRHPRRRNLRQTRRAVFPPGARRGAREHAALGRRSSRSRAPNAGWCLGAPTVHEPSAPEAQAAHLRRARCAGPWLCVPRSLWGHTA